MAAFKLLGKLLHTLDKLACLCFDHIDGIIETVPHATDCTCTSGGSHGRFDYACVRCGRTRSRIELIC